MAEKTVPALSEAQQRMVEEILARRFIRADPNHPVVIFLRRTAADRLILLARRDPLALEALGAVARAAVPGAGAPPDLRPPGRPLKEINPPPLSQSFLALRRAADDPRSSLADVAGVVSTDPGLSAFLLRLANSAYYSLPGKVDTVFRAAQLVGMREILAMSAARAAAEAFREKPRPDALDVGDFWRHSVACAIMAKTLARRCGRPDPERHFVAGLLHDVGRMLLAIAEPDMLLAVEAAALARGVPSQTVEREILGFDHAELGGTVLRRWRLPESLMAAVAWHHAPERDREGHGADVIHAADVLALSLGLGARPGCPAPVLDQAAWKGLGLAPEDLGPVIEECDTRLEEIHALFSG